MKANATLFLVLCAIVFLVSETSSARPIRSKLTLQFCENEVPCDDVRRTTNDVMRLVDVDLQSDTPNSRTLVFQDSTSGDFVRVVFSSAGRAQQVKMKAENGGYDHIYISGDRADIIENGVDESRVHFNDYTIFEQSSQQVRRFNRVR